MQSTLQLIILLVLLTNVSVAKANKDYDEYIKENIDTINEGKRIIESNPKSFSDCLTEFISKSIKKGATTIDETIVAEKKCEVNLERLGGVIWFEETPKVVEYMINELYKGGINI